MQHPQVNITSVTGPQALGTGAYVINASGPISNVTYFVLPDNRLVIDIHNAVNTIEGNLPVHPSVPLSEARIAQFSTSPMVTRVVFDLTSPAEFTLTLSQARDNLSVAFAVNTISSVRLESDGNSDTIIIQGSTLPAVRMSTEGFPGYLTLNIENATITAPDVTNASSGAFINRVAMGPRGQNAAYIRLYVGDVWPTFSVSHQGSTVRVSLHRAITGVRYDSLRGELHIDRSTGFVMDINQVRHVDEYLQHRYSIILPTAASQLGRGEIGVLDGLINSISIVDDVSGNARIQFNTARILGFTVHETPGSYIIRKHLPRDLHPFIVVLDPGHGGDDRGASHNGVVESHLVLTISQRVAERLARNPNIQVYMTRHTDVRVQNQHRADFANGIRADLFVSVHANAAVHSGTNIPNPLPHGIETWYNMGALETAASNIFTSRQFATIVQRHKLARTNANDRGLRYSAGLVVLRQTNMPAVLLELGFLTNPAEAARLNTAAHQELLVQAIYDAIVEAAALYSRR